MQISNESSAMDEFSIQRRIYYDDTDAGGVVYHTCYIRYMEHARTELLRARGFELPQLVQQHSILLAVAELNVRYLAPARLNDCIEITAAVQKLSYVRIQFAQSVWLLNQQQQRQNLLSTGQVSIVCLHADTFTPKRIPAFLTNLA